MQHQQEDSAYDPDIDYAPDVNPNGPDVWTRDDIQYIKNGQSVQLVALLLILFFTAMIYFLLVGR